MSDRLPERVNPYRLADQGRELRGTYPLDLMPRLAEAVAETTGEAVVHLIFTRSVAGLALIEGEIEATLGLICQRCLGLMNYPVKTKFTVALVPDEAAAGSILDEFDPMVIPDELFVRDLIEDELMLSLPLIARHESEEACEETMQEYLHKEFEPDAVEVDKKPNPFEVLSSLKDKH